MKRSRPRIFPALVLLIASLVPAASRAQAVQVALEVTERTGSPLGTAFTSALSAMNGVTLAEGGALADYFLTVAVLCVPDADSCAGADSYSVSVTLSEPLTGHELDTGLARTGQRALSDWDPAPEAEAFLQRFRRMHAVWAALWETESLERSVDRLLQGVDARCFQQRRVVEAERAMLLRRGDVDAARALTMNRSRDRNWLC